MVTFGTRKNYNEGIFSVFFVVLIEKSINSERIKLFSFQSKIKFT